MSNPFKQNFFPYPNIIVDELMQHMTPIQLVCLTAIIRKTIGWHKASDSISLSQFLKLTGIKSKTTVMRALNVLEQVELIAVTRKLRTTTVYTLGEVFYSRKCTREAITAIGIELGARNTPDRTIPISSIAPTIDSPLNIKEREKRTDGAQVKGEKEKRAPGAQDYAGASADGPTKNGSRSADGINPEMAEIFRALKKACKG